MVLRGIAAKQTLRSLSLRGCENCCVVVFRDDNLFGERRRLRKILRRVVSAEPHMLQKVVRVPHAEEPLDLFDELVVALRRMPRTLWIGWAFQWGRGVWRTGVS